MSYNNNPMFPNAGGSSYQQPSNMPYSSNPTMMNPNQQQQFPSNPAGTPMSSSTGMAMMPAGSYQSAGGMMQPYTPNPVGNTTQQFVQVQQVRRQVQTNVAGGMNQATQQQFMQQSLMQQGAVQNDMNQKFMEYKQTQDNLLRSTQEQVDMWKKKYEQTEALYQRLLAEHNDLQNKYKQLQAQYSQTAMAAQQLQSLQAQWKVKEMEVNNVLHERDSIKMELMRITQENEKELTRLRQEVANSQMQMSQIAQAKANELQQTVNQFNMEKRQMQEQHGRVLSELQNSKMQLEKQQSDLALSMRSQQSFSDEKRVLQDSLNSKLQEAALLQQELSSLKQKLSENEKALDEELGEQSEGYQKEMDKILDSTLQHHINRIHDFSVDLGNPGTVSLHATPAYALSLVEKVTQVVNEFGISYEKLFDSESPASAIENANKFADDILTLLNAQKSVIQQAEVLGSDGGQDPAQKLMAFTKTLSQSSENYLKQLKTDFISQYDDQQKRYIVQQGRTNITENLGMLNGLLETLGSLLAKSTTKSGDMDLDGAFKEAAKAIAAAAARLEALKNQASGHLTRQVHEAIVTAAQALTSAISHLIMCATQCQQDIVRRGASSNLSPSQFYSKNNRWTEGLISAARAVASATEMLVDNADGALKGTHRIEQLIVASREVAAATAQLVSASRVKSEQNSTIQLSLEDASKAVIEATKVLVTCAEKAIEERMRKEGKGQGLDDIKFGSLSIHDFKVAEMNQQVEILTLEKELAHARKKLGEMRKQNYSKE